MNLYWHILQKDCRRLAIPIALWLLLSAINTYFAIAGESGALVSAVWYFCAIVLFWMSKIIIAAGVILEDSPRGTSAFWLTRPLARGQVVAAKLSVLAALTVLPALVNAVRLVGEGAHSTDVAIGTLSAILTTAFVPVAIAAFAVTAETFGQFAITAILILLAGGMVTAVAGAVIKIRHLIVDPPPGADLGLLSMSRYLVVQSFTLAVALGIVIWRYLQRHARLVIPVLAVGTLACMLTPLYWSWDFVGRSKPAAVLASTEKPGLHFGLRTERGSNSQIVGTLSVESTRPNAFIVPTELTNLKLTWNSGETSEIRMSEDLVEGPNYPALTKFLAPMELLNLPATQPLRFSIPEFSLGLRGHLSTESGRLQARVEASIRAYETIGEIALNPGDRANWRHRRVTIEKEGHNADGDAEFITLRESFSNSALAVLLGAGERSVQRGEQIYLLVNRARGQAVIGKAGNNDWESNLAGYTTRSFEISFSHLPVDLTWVKQSVLVCVEFREVERAAGIATSTLAGPSY